MLSQWDIPLTSPLNRVELFSLNIGKDFLEDQPILLGLIAFFLFDATM